MAPSPAAVRERRTAAAVVAQKALAAGDDVVATARDKGDVEDAFPHLSTSGRILPVDLDVTDEAQAQAAVGAALAEFGGIDFLVNNAGRGLIGAVEEASAAEVRTVFDTNVFGALNVIRAALPEMRSRRSGHIVDIGSMGGFAQVAGWGVYGATKFALDGLSEAMHAELAPLGISVTIVEPASFRTSDPARGAAVIVEAVTSAHPPLRLQVGPGAEAMVEGKLDRVRTELE